MGIIGVGRPLDLAVAKDFGCSRINELQPNLLAVRRSLFQLRRKFPFASQGVPVSAQHPRAGFGMSAFGPVPETLPQEVVHFLERRRGYHVAVVIDPAPDDRVECANETLLTLAAVLSDHFPHFFQEVARILPGRLDQQFAVPFAQVLTEEVEPLVDVGDAGFLGRKLQASLAKELLHQRPNFFFQQLFRGAGDDEVVGVSHQVYLETGPLRLGELFPQKRLQSVQGQVRQRGGDDPALRRPCFRGEEGLIFHIPGFQPLTQHFLVRGHVAQYPVVADVIKTAANVTFQYPLRGTLSPQSQEARINGIRR